MEKQRKKLEPNEITKVILSICLHKSFELCGETLNREIGRKSWCHNGAQKEIEKFEKKMGFGKWETLHSAFPKTSPRNFPFAPRRTLSGVCRGDRRGKHEKSKFPYLRRQIRCTVGEPRRCLRASSRRTVVVAAYACPGTLINRAGVAGC